VAADGNGTMYPDQSLYPSTAVPAVVQRVNNALRAADRIEWAETRGRPRRHFMVPIVADADSGFGGPLNVFELIKDMIRAGAAGIHLEDQARETQSRPDISGC
jgi:isocitrate lyase